MIKKCYFVDSLAHFGSSTPVNTPVEAANLRSVAAVYVILTRRPENKI